MTPEGYSPPEIVEDSKIHTFKREFNKTKDMVVKKTESVLYLGDQHSTEAGVDNMMQALREKSRSKMIEIAIERAYRYLPENTKNKFLEIGQSELPLNIPEIEGFRVMDKLGEGWVNTVFKYEGTDEQVPLYAIGLERHPYPSSEDAVHEAAKWKNDYETVKTIYKDMPELIPKEDYAVVGLPNGPAVMSVREFVPGEIKDVFDYSKEELHALVTNNPEFANQLEMFMQISNRNMEYLLENELDILGKANLAVVGQNGNEKLVLLDPHTRRPEATPEIKNQLIQRFQFLNDVVKDVAKTEENPREPVSSII